MATRIVVDGYNLMWAGQGINPDDAQDLESAREDLIRKLSGYKKITGHRITLIFDGGPPGQIYPQRKVTAEIDVRFSHPPQKADDLIQNMAKDQARGSIVVTSDRELVDAVEARGSTAISSPEFMDRLKQAALSGPEDDIEEDDSPLKPAGTKKRGNPRRSSKKDRKRRERTKKL